MVCRPSSAAGKKTSLWPWQELKYLSVVIVDMLYDLPKLPSELQRRSQRHYLVFNFMNGISYRCV